MQDSSINQMFLNTHWTKELLIINRQQQLFMDFAQMLVALLGWNLFPSIPFSSCLAVPWEGNELSWSSAAEVLLSVPQKSPSNWEWAGRFEGENRHRFFCFLYATTFLRMFHSSEMFPSYPDCCTAQMANKSFKKAVLKQPHTCTQA